MRSVVKRICMRLFALALVGLMSIMVVNRILFLHVHILPDGTQLIHAHPYDKSTENSTKHQHEHTNFELNFLAALELLFFTSLLAIFLVITKSEFVRAPYLVAQYLPKFFTLTHGRAPPAHFLWS